MNDGQENRRSFRVNESVYVKTEILTEQEYEDGLEHRKIRLGESESTQAMLVDIEARLSEAMYRLNAESEMVGKCMTLLNDKINVVIDAYRAFARARPNWQRPCRCRVMSAQMASSFRASSRSRSARNCTSRCCWSPTTGFLTRSAA